jgi:hypothetical protein
MMHKKILLINKDIAQIGGMYTKSKTTFNLMVWFLSPEEGTEVIEGVDKKINELGRSVTQI